MYCNTKFCDIGLKSLYNAMERRIKVGKQKKFFSDIELRKIQNLSKKIKTLNNTTQ